MKKEGNKVVIVDTEYVSALFSLSFLQFPIGYM